MATPEDASRASTFVALGVLTTTQHIAGLVLERFGGADPQLVAEESLALVSVASARAASVGFDPSSAVRAAVCQSALELPYLYHEYLIGELSVREGRAAEDVAVDLHGRMDRIREFYLAHLPDGVFPGERALREKMELWMGRVSPPRTGVHPSETLSAIDAVAQVANHCRVVLAYCRSLGSTSRQRETS